MLQRETERTLATRPIPPLLPLSETQPLRGRYRLESQIGQGQTCVVYQAVDLFSRERCAIKMLRAVSLGQPELRQRFEHGVRILAQHSHPGVVTAKAFDIDEEGRPFIVMELLNGEDVGALLRYRRQLRLRQVCRIVQQTAEILSQLHQLGVVHGALMPANLFLCHEQESLDKEDTFSVKLLGLGTAKRFDAGCSSIDQLGLAAIAYWLLSGRPAFTSGESSEELKLGSHCPPPLHTLCANVSEPLSQVINRALLKNPDRRFESITKFARAFAAACQEPTQKVLPRAAVNSQVAVTPRPQSPAKLSPERLEQIERDQGTTVQMEASLLEKLRSDSVQMEVPSTTQLAPQNLLSEGGRPGAFNASARAGEAMLVISWPAAFMIVGVPLGLLVGALLAYLFLQLRPVSLQPERPAETVRAATGLQAQRLRSVPLPLRLMDEPVEGSQ